ncbi:hypothetical protein AN958_02045 [Leucoagaricus sp. SymC.cos]|nr:hypothetical protein AN958_02045 [Leucoagaricus sp. SymC.cos]
MTGYGSYLNLCEHVAECVFLASMASEESSVSRPPRQEPDLETVALAKLTRKTVERLAPFCQIRLPPETSRPPLAPKTNSKILRLIQAVDTSMLVAQIGYRLASDAASLCDPFAPSNQTAPGAKYFAGLSSPEMLQTMAAHGHGHCLKTTEAFRDVQQEIYKIAATTKDNETIVLVPQDPQQPATRRISLKDVGASLVANLSLLERFSRSVLDLTSWWEWLEEELMSPNSTLLPSIEKRDADLFARWSKIKGAYLDYYNTIRVVYARYPQLFTTSSSAWQSISSVPPVPSSPGSSWDGSYEDLGTAQGAELVEEARNSSRDLLNLPNNDSEKERARETKKKRDDENTRRVKAIAVKLGLVKLFEKEGKKGKEREKKVDENPVIDVKGSDGRVPQQETKQALVSEKVPEPTTVAPDAPVPGPSQPRQEKESFQAEKERQGNGTIIEHNTQITVSVGVESKPESSKHEKEGGMAKLFAAVKKVLGCQSDSGMEN